jgi:Arc/MetJ family transcription regulator
MRTTVVLDDELVAEAFALTGARTKKELLHLALEELVRARRRKDLTKLAGRIRFREDFDLEALRGLRSGSR